MGFTAPRPWPRMGKEVDGFPAVGLIWGEGLVPPLLLCVTAHPHALPLPCLSLWKCLGVRVWKDGSMSQRSTAGRARGPGDLVFRLQVRKRKAQRGR